MVPTDKMSIHSDLMFIITPHGRLTWIIPDERSRTGRSTFGESELLSLLHQSGVH